jgi:Arc/MetJ family transcription regulator
MFPWQTSRDILAMFLAPAPILMNTTYGGPERRTRPRAQVHIDSELRHGNVAMAVQTLDLSSHGAFVRTARPLPVGSVLRVALHRGAQRNPLVLDAEVVRVGTQREGRAPGLGLRFTDLSDIDVTSLQALIHFLHGDPAWSRPSEF